METDCRRENAPSLPVLKSFTLPRVNHLISLPVSASVLTAACRPRSRSSLQQPAAPAQRLRRQQRLVPGLLQWGREVSCFLPRAGETVRGHQPLTAPPAHRRTQETSQTPCKKPGMEKGKQGKTGSSMPPYSLCQKHPASSRRSRMQ